MIARYIGLGESGIELKQKRCSVAISVTWPQ